MTATTTIATAIAAVLVLRRPAKAELAAVGRRVRKAAAATTSLATVTQQRTLQAVQLALMAVEVDGGRCRLRRRRRLILTDLLIPVTLGRLAAATVTVASVASPTAGVAVTSSSAATAPSGPIAGACCCLRSSCCREDQVVEEGATALVVE